MKRHLAGIAVTVESPSCYRIDIPVTRHSHPIQASWIKYNGAAWIIAWQSHNRVIEGTLLFPSAWAVAEYLVAITNGAKEFA